jgi:hypothetical protein
VGGRLFIDLGGIHLPVQKSVTLSSANAATYGLTDGSVYEVVVFQAERQTSSSSYALTIKGSAPPAAIAAPTRRRLGLPGRLAQNCDMNFQASGGMKAFRPSSPLEVPSSTLDGVCAPSNVHALTG